MFAIYYTWTADAAELQEWIFHDFLHPGQELSKQENECPHKFGDPPLRKKLSPCGKSQ